MRKQKGFSLIELLIVVAIILIIAAIAIPNLLRSRIAANEASAVGSLRTINTSEISYSTTYSTQGFSADLASLGGAVPCTAALATACLIDDSLAKATAAPGKSGYLFGYTPGAGGPPVTGYTLTATPVTVGQSGQRMFCTDQTGVIRADPSGAGCTTASTPI